MQSLLNPNYTTIKNNNERSSKIWGRSLCIVAALIFVAIILTVGYIGGNSKTLDNSSPAASLIVDNDKPNIDNSHSYQSKLFVTHSVTSDDDTEDAAAAGSEPDFDDVDDVIHRTIIASDESLATEYYNSNGEDDTIDTMPFLLKATCSSSTTNCGFNQYSGYLLANDNAEIHYWFIEADTNQDTTTLPVFFWTNGGPGCSGMDGLLTEHGPWKVYDNLKIHYNPHSWINEVNMVYLEQPYGVGFSVVSDGDDVVGGDQNSADDMDAVIRNFLTKFPDYSESDIYLSSESWGGHYVPMTTYTILENNANGKVPYINLKGFLLGNPYTDSYENAYGFVGDIYGHGLMKSTDWDTWRSECWDNEDAIDSSEVCSAIYTRAYYSAYNANVYALDWPQCYLDEIWDLKKTEIQNDYSDNHWIKDAHIHRTAHKYINKVLNHKDYKSLRMNIDKNELELLNNKLESRLSKQSGNQKQIKQTKIKSNDDSNDELIDDTNLYLPCIEYNMADYLNLDIVQSALNVKSTEWEMCSDDVYYAWPESDYSRYIQHYYTEITEKYSSDLNLKLCVYSGDDDSVCGLQGTQYWLDRWDYVVNGDIEWNEWEDDDNQLGGYYTQYIMDNDDSSIALHFITVRTAGHMVPTTEPKRALTLLQKFLNEMETS